MSNPYFEFKQFVVHHAYSTMKVGTDAVLLGALVDLPEEGEILDVGTGSGLIALMMAHRCNANITGIDIHQNSVWEARANFKSSPWSNRLKALLISFQLYAAQGNPVRYKRIVSNPPFFENDLKSPDEQRNLARHNDQLSYRDFLASSRNFIHPEGEIWLILPPPEAEQFTKIASEFGFYLWKTIAIEPKPNREANRLILAFGNTPKDNIETSSLCIRNNDNSYTEAYQKLTEDFYVSLKS